MSSESLVPVVKIVAADRVRKDVGDLSALCQSIELLGLLHPVVLTKDLRLVSGRRRLAAFEQLRRDEIPARIVANLDEASLLLKAERDENVCRKTFTPSEAVAMGEALEELERPKAAERQRAAGASGGNGGRGNKKPYRKISGRVSRETRDVVGSAVGMSGKQYEKAKKVVDAGKTYPERFQPMLDEMDRTGKVEPAYRRVMADIAPPVRRQSLCQDIINRLSVVSKVDANVRERFGSFNKMVKSSDWPKEETDALVESLKENHAKLAAAIKEVAGPVSKGKPRSKGTQGCVRRKSPPKQSTSRIKKQLKTPPGDVTPEGMVCEDELVVARRATL